MYYSTYRFRVTTGDSKKFMNEAGVLCDSFSQLCMLPAGGKLVCGTIIKIGDMTPSD